MATGKKISTWYQGAWHRDDVMIMRAADHGSWLGSSVFDGARYFNGCAPDLLAHCRRVKFSSSNAWPSANPAMATSEQTCSDDRSCPCTWRARC